MAGITEALKNLEITKEEVETLGEALKNKEFRKMLIDYVEEIQNPENQKTYEKEIIELEKQRGVDVTFIKPNAGYVLKTSADGEKKVFINVCSNDIIQKPSSNRAIECGSKGFQWQVPHTLTPPRDDVDKKGNMCKTYDFVCHSDTLALAQKAKHFKEMLNNIACEAIETNFNVKLDKENLQTPKMQYKGRPYSAVIRKPCNDVSEVQPEDKEFVEKLFSEAGCPYKPVSETQPIVLSVPNKQMSHSNYTTPKYIIKHRNHIEMEQFLENKTAKLNSAIPKELVIEVMLPLIKTTSDVTLDVNEKKFHLISEKPARYKLDLNLPYKINENLGNAKFEKDQKKLIVTLPVKRNSELILSEFSREDSGIESDLGSFISASPIERNKTTIEQFVTEINTTENNMNKRTNDENEQRKCTNLFLDSNVFYMLPDYSCHFFENVFFLTLNVKNVADSSLSKTFDNTSQAVHLKFTSISSGFFPLYYAFYFQPVNATIDFNNVVAEVWDNNVEVQIPVQCDNKIESFLIGIDNNNLSEQYLNKNRSFSDGFEEEIKDNCDNKLSAIHSTDCSNGKLGINTDQSEEDSTNGKNNKERKKSKSKTKQHLKLQKKCHTYNNKISSKAIDIAGTYESSGDELSCSYSPCNKGILKNISYAQRSASRSMSESSIDDMMLISSFENCHSVDSIIPEEYQHVSTSLKKTVRFNDVVSKKVFRSNSSILGQRKKNQRKAKAKKRAQERKHSESELSENEEKKEQGTSYEVKPSSEKIDLNNRESNASDKSVQSDNEFSNDIFLMEIDF